MRPRAFSMSFECIACPSTMVCKTSITRMCLLAAMRTCGMFGWTTKPSHVLTSAKCVFFQLSGVPKARSVANRQVYCPLAAKQPQEVIHKDEVPIHLREKCVEDPE